MKYDYDTIVAEGLGKVIAHILLAAFGVFMLVGILPPIWDVFRHIFF